MPVAGVGLGTRRVSDVMARSSFVRADGVAAFAEEAAADHPADPIATIAVANAMARHDSPGAMRWLNRAMELAPAWSAPHVVSAGLLARRGAHSQALVEAYEAEVRRPRSSAEITCWLAARLPLSTLLQAVVPRSDAAQEALSRARFADRIAGCLEGAEGERFDAALIESGSSDGAWSGARTSGGGRTI